jgi:hypothetical protein
MSYGLKPLLHAKSLHQRPEALQVPKVLWHPAPQ